MKVAFFATCIGDAVAVDAAISSVKILEAAGCEVEFPEAQTCCGQPAITMGEPNAAARLARHFIEVFERYEYVIAPSGSCVGTIHHWYSRLFADDKWKSRAENVASKTYELTQFLVDVLQVTDIGSKINGKVVCHDSCHGLRNLGVKSQPRVLVAAAGAELVELEEPESCCGFGGAFSVSQSAISTKLADEKLKDAKKSDAQFVVACDSSCLLHLEGRQRRLGEVEPKLIHVASLLASGLSQ